MAFRSALFPIKAPAGDCDTSPYSCAAVCLVAILLSLSVKSGAPTSPAEGAVAPHSSTQATGYDLVGLMEAFSSFTVASMARCRVSASMSTTSWGLHRPPTMTGITWSAPMVASSPSETRRTKVRCRGSVFT